MKCALSVRENDRIYGSASELLALKRSSYNGLLHLDEIHVDVIEVVDYNSIFRKILYRRLHRLIKMIPLDSGRFIGRQREDILSRPRGRGLKSNCPHVIIRSP